LPTPTGTRPPAPPLLPTPAPPRAAAANAANALLLISGDDGVAGPAESAGDDGGVAQPRGENVRAVGSSRRCSVVVGAEGVKAGAAGLSFVAKVLASAGAEDLFVAGCKAVMILRVHAGGP